MVHMVTWYLTVGCVN